MPGFSPGIKQGVATTLWVKTGEESPAEIFFRDDIDAARAADRRQQLLETLTEPDFQEHYKKATPLEENRYSFRPAQVSDEYREWPKIVDLCSFFSNGPMEKRGGSLISSDKSKLSQAMNAYYDKQMDWNEYRASYSSLTKKQSGFNPKKAREKAIAKEAFDRNRLVRYILRPFDLQWCYYTPLAPLWNRARPQLWEQVWDKNRYFLTRLRAGKEPEGVPVHYVKYLPDDHIISPDAIAIPTLLRVQTVGISGPLLGSGGTSGKKEVANISSTAGKYFEALGLDQDSHGPKLWLHALCIGSSHLYLSENADGVKRDWPRVPLPASRELLDESDAIGKRLSMLLDAEASVDGVTTGTVRAEIAIIGNLALMGTDPLDPDQDLKLTRGWGHRAGNGINPGKGSVVERDYTPSEREAIELGAQRLGLTIERALKLLGQTTFDVYLNTRAYWKNVPANVWDYYIGGYQVIKKWLSYREAKIVGRSISIMEADHVRDMARRLAAICLLGDELDRNYSAVKANSFDWKKIALHR